MIEATVDGVVSERWNDATRTYTRLDPSGSVTETRPFTTEENAEADIRQAAGARELVAVSMRDQARASIDTLLASIDSLQAVVDKANNQIGPADTKTIARESRRIARQLIAVTRLVVGALDSNDIGD